ncbi:MAG: YqgE/AlgH family protein [Neisseriaceae bacterium]|nr:YqgE/AlgH family protein [Neisseriaceae bacterium]MBQ9619315.1 YqgE/AlgH family protein [Neisseriaceae bacterium]
MADFFSLTNHFLIATPALNDSFFAGSVIYLCDHSPQSALGVMINKPSSLRMEQLFKSIDKPMPKKFSEQWILLGGPVQTDRGFLLHSPAGNWESSLQITNDIALTASKDVLLDDLSDDKSLTKSIATIGCSGWLEGQLEEELNKNHWLIAPMDFEVLFDIPYYRRYSVALSKLGIRAEQLSSGMGHA